MTQITISKRLVACRKKAGFSRKAFSQRTNIPLSTLRNYEKENVPTAFSEALRKYHVYCNASYDYILEGTPTSVEDDVLVQKFKKLSTRQKETLEPIIDSMLNKET